MRINAFATGSWQPTSCPTSATSFRTSRAFAVGNVNDRGLLEAWDDPAYVALRERLLNFDFAPCTICNSCDMADENLEECFGSVAPACGGCLWAQGFIQCP